MKLKRMLKKVALGCVGNINDCADCQFCMCVDCSSARVPKGI